MFHPTYAWIFFNWYRDKFWIVDNPSCLMDKSAQPEDLERVLRTSIIMDQWPTIEDDEIDKSNIGNIVRNTSPTIILHIIYQEIFMG